jgi:hypothetical protein
MSYLLIGAGAVGQALAKSFARKQIAAASEQAIDRGSLSLFLPSTQQAARIFGVPCNAVAALFSILLKQAVALGEKAHHFCHVLGSPSAQRDNLVGQTPAERGQRVVHARRHLLVVGPRQHVIGL